MKTKIFSFCLMGLTALSGVAFAGDTEPALKVAKVAHIKGMDKAPEAIQRVAPVYPMELRERGIQGVATVEMLIDSTGRVVEAKAVRATMPAFAAQAEAAAKQWTFRPAEASGKKITARVMVPFEFTMPQVAALESR
jgi:TonB family protein